MSLLKYLVGCASVLLVFSYIGAAEVPKIEKRIDDSLQTYVLEPTNDFEQQDVTTIIPPLIEGEPSPNVQQVVDSISPDTNIAPNTNINSNPENEIKIPDGPVEQYFYPPQYFQQYQQYPWPYFTQPYIPPPQQPSYGADPNLQSYVSAPQQNTQAYVPQTNAQTYAPPSKVHYYPMQAEFEGVVVPIQPYMQPPPPPQPLEQPQQQTQQTNVNKDPKDNNKISPARTNYDLAILLQALLPPSVRQTLFYWINFIVNSFSVMAFAAVITSAICSLTPICELTFGALPISFQRKFAAAKWSNEKGTQITTMQRVRRAAKSLSDAIEKYETLEKNVLSIKQTLNKAKSF